MSEADKLFEELGYEKVQSNENQRFHIEYIKDEGSREIIQIWDDRSFNKIEDEESIGYFTVLELQAIYLKYKELGWLNEESNMS